MLTVAALIIVVLAVAHSWLGERYLLMRLFRRCDMPPLLGSADFTKNTLRFVWHLVTVMALGWALLLLQLAARAPAAEMAVLIGAALIVSGLLPLFWTRARHLSWVGLMAAGVLCLVWAAQ
jgi:hypothetical protein